LEIFFFIESFFIGFFCWAPWEGLGLGCLFFVFCGKEIIVCIPYFIINLKEKNKKFIAGNKTEIIGSEKFIRKAYKIGFSGDVADSWSGVLVLV
jgi:hypothetical protein